MTIAAGWTEDPTIDTAHRPWPLPGGPWVMAQRWSNLLFAHWRVAPAVLQPLVPEPLSLDLHSGAAWVSVTPFYLSHLRARGVPAFPTISEFPELNVRSYVLLGDKPGVYFFSLDAGSLLAVAAARTFYHLPYQHAEMKVEETPDGAIAYTSRRKEKEAPSAEFAARYRPTGEPYRAEPGSLDHWLAERYCLYALDGTAVYRAEIHHKPWPLQHAEAQIATNTMAAASGIALTRDPERLTFAKALDVVVWLPERIV